MSLMSISIDMSGSTAAKQKIRQMSAEEQSHVLKGYQDYLTHFFHIEMDFYSQLVHNGLEIEKVFVPKIIGDEVWAVYDIDGTEPKTPIFNSIFSRILTSTRSLHDKYYNLYVTGHGLAREQESKAELQKEISFEHLLLVPRVFVDYINDYQEISKIRFNVFRKRFDDLFPIKPKMTKQDRTERDERFCNILERLNVGMCLEKSGSKVKYAQRFDAIGFDIDLFFRCAANVLPGFTGVGKRLFNLLYQDNPQEVERNSFVPKYVVPTSIDGSLTSTRNEFYMCACQNIDAGQLTGISHDYQIYYFFKDSDARDMKNRASEFGNSPYQDTAEFMNEINLKL